MELPGAELTVYKMGCQPLLNFFQGPQKFQKDFWGGGGSQMVVEIQYTEYQAHN